MKGTHIKRLSALLLLLAMLVSLAACGSTDSGSTAAKDTSAKAEATPAPEFAYKAEDTGADVRCGRWRLARVRTGPIRRQDAAEIL